MRDVFLTWPGNRSTTAVGQLCVDTRWFVGKAQIRKVQCSFARPLPDSSPGKSVMKFDMVQCIPAEVIRLSEIWDTI